MIFQWHSTCGQSSKRTDLAACDVPAPPSNLVAGPTGRPRTSTPTGIRTSSLRRSNHFAKAAPQLARVTSEAKLQTACQTKKPSLSKPGPAQKCNPSKMKTCVDAGRHSTAAPTKPSKTSTAAMLGRLIPTSQACDLHISKHRGWLLLYFTHSAPALSTRDPVASPHTKSTSTAQGPEGDETIGA